MPLMDQTVAIDWGQQMHHAFFTFGILCCLALTPTAPIAAAPPDFEAANTERITIHTPTLPGPDGKARPRPAAPYPSVIRVTGFADDETVGKITVTLHDLSHETPDD